LVSMQKMRELEKDRPLWEAEANKRHAREEREAREREAGKQAHEQARAEAEFARRQERARHCFHETEAARIKKEQEMESFMSRHWFQKQSSFTKIHWTLHDARVRYVDASNTFDNTDFQKTSATFDNIPWPIEKDPRSASFRDITWEAVESFFSGLEQFTDENLFRSLVSKSHLRFHPDRWRSRKVLYSVTNEIERECLQNAANIVSQALTPIWSRVTQRAE